MRSAKGIGELKDMLDKLTSFIENQGTEEESENEDLHFAYDVMDTIDWVLGDISNKDFSLPPYLNMPALKKLVEIIEERTGNKMNELLSDQ